MPSHVLLDTKLDGLSLLRRGKVRDVYTAGDRLIMVATDLYGGWTWDLLIGCAVAQVGRLQPLENDVWTPDS